MNDLSPRFITFASIALLLASSIPAGASDSTQLWQDSEASNLFDKSAKRSVEVSRFRALTVDHEALEETLALAPAEVGLDLNVPIGQTEAILSLPLPDGGFSRFRIFESPIMEPELAAKFPEIKTYRAQGIDDRGASGRLDLTPQGFHAIISSSDGTIYIDPAIREPSDHYISYWARDARSRQIFECGVHGEHDFSELVESYRASRGDNGTMLRTYRLAVAATGEYTAFHGGTVPLGQAAIVTAMNRVNEIYESEVAIRMVLVANNDLVVYTNPATDPYSNNDGGTMLGQNQANLDSVIGTANYDIGHVFSTGGGGVATLRSPCVASIKARGVTGLPSPNGDPFWVDYVSHEMGHQWGGNHTFNGTEGSCSGGNRNPSTAYEPGSGTTIQAYAGICGSQNLQNLADAYFHGISLDEIIAFSTAGAGDTCASHSATGNSPPVADAGGSFTIPLETPFELCGSGTDPDEDPLTFAWEQFDLGPAGAPQAPVGNAPIFRSFNPTDSPCRTFPRMSDLAAGTLVLGELLPTYARTMNFRLTARDNRSGGGGVHDDSTTVTVSDTSGPFRLLSPNTSVPLPQGTSQMVSWDVASTDTPPVSCAAVDILLSSDGGMTYPTVLAAGVANSGTRSVDLPDSGILAARIQVRCSDNIFFDISDTDFSIGVPAVTISSPADGSLSVSGDSITFTGSASDPEDGDLSASLSWSSSLDGVFGSGASFAVSNLSLGSHVITASVTDSDTNTGTAEISLEVEPQCIDEIEFDGFETDNDGWVDGASTCTTGTFIRGTPDEVISNGVTTQVGGAATGDFAWFTQNNGGGAGTDDVDNGTCETLSSSINVGSGSLVSVYLDYFHGQSVAGNDPEDGFSLELIDGDTNAVLSTLVDIGDVVHQAEWTHIWVQYGDSPANIRLRARATDGATSGNLVEAGLDNIRVCTGVSGQLFVDGFESGDTVRWSATVP